MFAVQSVNIIVNTYDKNFTPLLVDQIIIDGVLNPSFTVTGPVNTASVIQRVQDQVTVSVGKILYTAYSQVFDTHYGADGNLEDIVINVIMFPISTLAADIASFITNFCIPPITRIKGTHPDGDQYKLYATMNEPGSYTIDWEYPAFTPIGTGQTVEAQFGAVGLKSVEVHLDDGVGNDCQDAYTFILQNLNINVCFGQELQQILDSGDVEVCSIGGCPEPFDMSQTVPACCNTSTIRFRFVFKNLDDEAITLSPADCALLTETVTGSGVFHFFTVSTFSVEAGENYIIDVLFKPFDDCICGVHTGTVFMSMQSEGNIGIGACCNISFDVTGEIQNREFSLSTDSVSVLAGVGDCVTQVVTMTNIGCANLKVPQMTNSPGGCFEMAFGPVVSVDYDSGQLAALPIDGDGDHYLAPSATIDIIVQYCPDQAQNGCCNAIDFVGECNTVTLKVCYTSIVPPSCIEFLIHPCDTIKLTVPNSANEVADEPAVDCIIPNTDFRIQGNAFFPACATTGCEDEDCALTVSWENLTTGNTLTPVVYDPDTFIYSALPIWEYIFQFPEAGVWRLTVTAQWCGTTIVCQKEYRVCHEINVQRLKCHLRRININSIADIDLPAQDVTVVVESAFDDSFSQTYTFNTSSQSFIDVVLPQDGVYRVTITFEIDATTRIFYIDEICALAECYREMVLKIMCADTADPCCKNCDPKEIERRKKLRYMVTQIVALFTSVTAMIHRDTMSYLGIWEDDECRQASQQEISELITALQNAVLRCGVCEESVAAITSSQGCKNC